MLTKKITTIDESITFAPKARNLPKNYVLGLILFK